MMRTVSNITAFRIIFLFIGISATGASIILALSNGIGIIAFSGFVSGISLVGGGFYMKSVVDFMDDEKRLQ